MKHWLYTKTSYSTSSFLAWVLSLAHILLGMGTEGRVLTIRKISFLSIHQSARLWCFQLCLWVVLLFVSDLNAHNITSRSEYIDPSVVGLKIESETNTRIDVFQLFSHGRSGELFINGQWLGKEAIVHFLGSHLSLFTSHINIYGCNFAQGQKGKAAVAYLEKELGISVSASTNITGKGGDWNLEVGKTNNVIALPNYQGNLQCPLGTTIGASQYALASSGGYPADVAIGKYAAGAPDGYFTSAYSTGTFYAVQLSYLNNFYPGDEVTLTAAYNDSRIDGIYLDFSIDGVNWQTSPLFNPPFTTTLTDYTYKIPTSFSGPFAYIQIRGNSANSYVQVDAVKVTSTSCNMATVNTYLDNGAGGGTSKDCIQNGTEPSLGTASGLFINIIKTGAVVNSFPVGNPTTLSNLADGSYTMIISENPLDVTPKLYTYTTSSASKSISVANGVITPAPLDFCMQILDSDGDGIADSIDLDDDNDGILDTAEMASATPPTCAATITGQPDFWYDIDNVSPCMTCLATNVDGNPWLTTNFSQFSRSWISGNGWTIAGGSINGAWTFSTYPTTIANAIANNNYFEFSYTPKNYMTMYDFKSFSLDADVRIDYSTSSSFTSPTTIYTGHPVAPINFTNFPLTTPLVMKPGVQYFIRVYFANITPESARADVDTWGWHWRCPTAVEYPAALTTADKDTDGDGIADRFDLDSDGDGCPDALEGGANLAATSLVTSSIAGGNSGAGFTGTSTSPVVKNLGNTIDANGIPTIAGTGQTVGNSADKLVQSANCGTCNAGTTAPSVSATTLSNTCPATTVNLNSLVTSTAPSGTSLEWFTDSTHTGTAYATPTTAAAGTYYAFYYDAVNGCYSPADSVTVTINSCASTSCSANLITNDNNGTFGTNTTTGSSNVTTPPPAGLYSFVYATSLAAGAYGVVSQTGFTTWNTGYWVPGRPGNTTGAADDAFLHYYDKGYPAVIYNAPFTLTSATNINYSIDFQPITNTAPYATKVYVQIVNSLGTVMGTVNSPAFTASDPVAWGTIANSVTLPAGTYTLMVINTSTNSAGLIDNIKVTTACPVGQPDLGSIGGITGGTVIANVTANDQVYGGADIGVNVTIAPLGTWTNGISLNTSTGAVTVPPNTPVGTYTFSYNLCEIGSTVNCSATPVTINVGTTATSCGGFGGLTGPNDDYDGDSVCNKNDLDDDNDGILDDVESPTCATTVSTATYPALWNANGIPLNNTPIPVVWDTYNPGSSALPNLGMYSNVTNLYGLQWVGTDSYDIFTSNTDPITFTVAGGDIDKTGDPTQSVYSSYASFFEYNTQTPVGATVTYTNVYDVTGKQLMNMNDIEFFSVGYGYGTIKGTPSTIDPSVVSITNPTPGTFVVTKVSTNDAIMWNFRTKDGSLLQRYSGSVVGMVNDGFIPGLYRNIGCTIVKDSDGDGIADKFDLDSDNDGCTDAIEGGASFTSANLVASTLSGGNTGATSGTFNQPVTQNLGNTVDANGIPTIATATGQTVGTSQNAVALDAQGNCVVVCNDPTKMAATCDYDGDGVINSVDLDDDNDGILDKVEGNCLFTSQPFTISNTNNSYVFNNSYDWNTNAPDPYATTTIPTYGLPESTSLGKMMYENAQGAYSGQIDFTNGPLIDPVIEYKNIDFSKLSFFDVNDNPVTIVPVWVNTETAINGNEISDANNSTTHPNYYDGPADTGGLPERYTESADGYITIKGTFSSIKYAGVPNPASDGHPYRDGWYVNVYMYNCNLPDTDGDGIANYLDLDSDGDGCPDALEGGANLAATSLVTSSIAGGNSGAGFTGTSTSPVVKNLGNTIDANGIPTIAGTGQTVGNSADKLVQSANCGTCNAGTTAPSVSATTLSNTCPATTVNLNSLVTSTAPSGTSLEWFTDSTHTGTAYATPTTAAAGTYYAFYYDAVNGCYSPADSVTVTINSCASTSCSANLITNDNNGTFGTNTTTGSSNVTTPPPAGLYSFVYATSLAAGAYGVVSQTGFTTWNTGYWVPGRPGNTTGAADDAFLHYYDKGYPAVIYNAPFTLTSATNINYSIDFQPITNTAPYATKVYVQIVNSLGTVMGTVNSPAFTASDPVAWGTIANSVTLPAGTYTLMVINTSTNSAGLIDNIKVTTACPVGQPDLGSIGGITGGTVIANVTANDQVYGGADIGVNVTIAPLGTWTNGISLNTSTGAVTVPPNTPVGTYTFSYNLCEIGSTVNCSATPVTINVGTTATSCGGFGGLTGPNDDYDGDSVCNKNDLDDDNDGILDDVESPTCATTVSTATYPALWNANGIPLNNTPIPVVWDTYNPGSSALPNLGMYSNVTNLYGLQWVGTDSYDIFTSNTDPITFTVAGGDIDKTGDPTQSVYSSYASFFEYNTQTPVGATVTYTNVYDVTGKQLMNMNDIEFFSVGYGYGTIKGTPSTIDPSVVSITNPTPGTFVVTKVSTNDAIMWNFRTKDGSLLQRYSGSVVGMVNDGFIPGLYRNIGCTIVKDSDGDGIADKFDLDSDNDGCTDAIEGGASFTSANLVASTLSGGNTGATSGTFNQPVTQNLGNTVDANGIPTIATATGQTVGTSQNAVALDAQGNCVVVCNDPTKMAATCDYDGDGVINSVDLDDDNDGILDKVEGNCLFTSQPFTISNTNNSYVFNNSYDWNTNAPDPYATTTIPTYGLPESTSLGKMMYENAQGAYSGQIDFTNGPLIDPVIEYKNIDFSKLSFFDVNDNPVTIVPVWVNTETAINGNEISDANNSTTHPNYYDGPADTGGLPERYTESADGYITIKGTFSSIKYAGVPNPASDGHPYRDGWYVNVYMYNCNLPDTDGDGIANYLDLDSDGDGCPDALEGGANLATSSLVTSTIAGGNSGTGYTGSSTSPVVKNLGNTIDANGIPTIAGTGQTVGNSADKLVQSANCVTCLAGTAAPIITPTTAASTCPSATINLATLPNTGTQPAGTTLIWSTHTTPLAASDTLSNLTISTAGTYYALYYDKVNNCYSPADSVIVTITNCTDFDGDGILDTADLDDDNDGILDLVECPVLVPPTVETITGPTAFGTVTYTPSSAAVQTLSALTNGSIADAINIIPANTGTPTVFTIPLVTPRDVNQFFLYNDAGAPGDAVANFTVKLYDANNTLLTTLTAVGTNGVVKNQWDFPITAKNVTKMEFTTIYWWSHTNGNSQIREIALGYYDKSCDTDGDGIANSFDLDSDNDGCSDAFEAGATTNTTPNYQFPAASVGTNGLSSSVENNDTPSATTTYTSTYSIAINSGIKSCCPSTAPTLSGTTISNTCPATTANLSSLVTSTAPSGASLVWFTDNAHTGTAYATPTTAAAGTYYAFYFDATNNCYSPATSGVVVTINACNDAPVITSTTTVNYAENGTTPAYTTTATDPNAGQTKTYSLETGGVDNALFTINPTTGEVSFNTSPNFESPTDAGADNVYNIKVKVCDNGTPQLCDIEDVAITVTDVVECLAGTTAPSVSGTTLSNTCPSVTANLNNLVTSTAPSGTTVVWFTNNAHTGTAYSTPTMAVAGTYYAFYFDATNNCYSPATSGVIVTITTCSVSCDVPKPSIISN